MTDRRFDDLEAAARAATDLRWIAELWAMLAEARIPGTARARRESELTPERREELDHEARLERAERAGLSPGEHPVPIDLDVMLVLGDVAALAGDLADLVAQAVMRPLVRMVPLTSSFSDPRRMLTYAADHLVEATEANHQIGPYAAQEARTVRAEVVRVLGLQLDGQLLTAICPWCDGAWFGRRTLRVRLLPGGSPAIVCESGVCTPPYRDAGTWWRGAPCWPLHLWAWLDKQLHARDRRGRIGA